MESIVFAKDLYKKVKLRTRLKYLMIRIPELIWREIKLLFDFSILIEYWRIHLELQIMDYSFYRQSFFFFRIAICFSGLFGMWKIELFRTDGDKKQFGNKVITVRFPRDYTQQQHSSKRTFVFTRYYKDIKYAPYIKFLFKRKEKI